MSNKSFFGNKPGGNYSEFENDGTYKMFGNATVWEDLRFPVNSVILPAANAPTKTAYKGSIVLAFSSASDNKITFAAQMPHSWKEGSDIYPHVHFVVPTAGAGGGAENLKLDLTYSWANKDAAYPGETTQSITNDIQNLAADTHTIHAFTQLSGTGKTLSSILLCSLNRDISVANDYADNMYLLEVDIHYEQDTIGSRQELVK